MAQSRQARARSGLAWVLGAAGAAAVGIACASIIGIEDRLPDDLTADATDEALDAGQDIAVALGCTTAQTCTQVPEGWKLVAVSTQQRTGCPSGYDAPEDLVVAGDGVACSCACTEAEGGACAAPNSNAQLRVYNAAGCGSSLGSYFLTGLDAGCFDGSTTMTAYVRVPPANALPPVCNAASAPSKVTNGRACRSQGDPCDGGLCAARLPAGERLCVTKPGDVTCPAGYEKKIPSGTSATDTRKCGACTCTPDTLCGSPVVELYSGGQCSKERFAIPANGSCTSADSGAVYGSYRYSGTAPGCQPSVPALLDGGLAFQGPSTVCCEQRD
jgi:hypothetical protein